MTLYNAGGRRCWGLMVSQIAGNLRRWARATNADNKSAQFGFAEYEDAGSLGTAAEIFKDLEVPIKPKQANGVKVGEENGEIEKVKLVVRLYCDFGLRMLLISMCRSRRTKTHHLISNTTA